MKSSTIPDIVLTVLSVYLEQILVFMLDIIGCDNPNIKKNNRYSNNFSCNL